MNIIHSPTRRHYTVDTHTHNNIFTYIRVYVYASRHIRTNDIPNVTYKMHANIEIMHINNKD